MVFPAIRFILSVKKKLKMMSNFTTCEFRLIYGIHTTFDVKTSINKSCRNFNVKQVVTPYEIQTRWNM